MWFALALLGAVPKLSSLASPDFVNAEGRPVHLLGEASEHCLIKKYVYSRERMQPAIDPTTKAVFIHVFTIFFVSVTEDMSLYKR